MFFNIVYYNGDITWQLYYLLYCLINVSKKKQTNTLDHVKITISKQSKNIDTGKLLSNKLLTQWYHMPKNITVMNNFMVVITTFMTILMSLYPLWMSKSNSKSQSKIKKTEIHEYIRHPIVPYFFSISKKGGRLWLSKHEMLILSEYLVLLKLTFLT